MAEFKAGHTGGPGGWRGVLRLNGRIVWTCPHVHRNRDHSSLSEWSARSCSYLMLDLILRGEEVIRLMRQYANTSYNYGARSQADLERAQSFMPKAVELRAAHAACECPRECDCENYVAGLVSNECPVHNLHPKKAEECAALVHHHEIAS